jgi:hypothetical protein
MDKRTIVAILVAILLVVIGNAWRKAQIVQNNAETKIDDISVIIR